MAWIGAPCVGEPCDPRAPLALVGPIGGAIGASRLGLMTLRSDLEGPGASPRMSRHQIFQDSDAEVN